MKCVCISCFNNYDTRMKTVINFFEKHNYKVTYVISDYNHINKKYYKAKYSNCKQLHVIPYTSNISIKRLCSHWLFAKKVYRELLEIKPEIIYCMFPPNSLVQQVIKFKRKFNVKVIFDCYDMWPESFPKGNYKRLLVFPFQYWRNLRDRYIGFADSVVTVSDKAKNELAALVKRKDIKILMPTIYDSARPKYLPDIQNTISFCYLGNINHITDIKLAEELLGTIAKKKQVKLHMIGTGERYLEFVQRMEEKGVVVFDHGIVFDMEEKNKIFSVCQFGLNIPKQEIQSSMSLKSIEYLRAGLPMINSGIADTYAIVEKEQLGINVKGIKETAKEILNIKPEHLIEMHKKCLAYYDKVFVKQDVESILGKLI